MFQRPAKMQSRVPDDGRVPLTTIINFLETAERDLADANESDAAFYFTQLREHLQKNPHEGFNGDPGRILGL